VCSRLDEKMGDLHVRMGAYRDAQMCFARARALETRTERRADLWRKEGLVWGRLGQPAQALALLAQAERGEGGDGAPVPARLCAEIAIEQSLVYWQSDDLEQSIDAAQRAQELLLHEPPDDAVSLLVARAGHREAVAYQFGGDFVRAEECYRRCLPVLERLGDQLSIAQCLANMADLASFFQIPLAEDYARRSLLIMERLGDQQGIAQCLETLGELWLFEGDLGEADRYIERGHAMLEQSEDGSELAWSWKLWADVALEQGRLQVAASRYRRARRLARHSWHVAWAVLGQAQVCLRAGRLGRAAILLQCARPYIQGDAWLLREAALPGAEWKVRALIAGRGTLAEAIAEVQEAIRLTSEPPGLEETLARRLLGQCSIVGGSFSEAERHLRTALTAQIALGAGLEAARTRLILAEALVGAGGGVPVPDDARTLLAEALTQFTVSGALLDVVQATEAAAEWGVTLSPDQTTELQCG
jgi:tetratricopeptide (TPR) repeat protein